MLAAGSFLFPQYGFSELPQAFSRLCAVSFACFFSSFPTQIAVLQVNSGIFILQFPPKCIVFDKIQKESSVRGSLPTFRGVVTGGNQYISADFLVSSPDFLPNLVCSKRTAEHCVCITDAPIHLGSSDSSPGLCLLTVPPGAVGNKNVVRVMQQDDSSQVCSKGKCNLRYSNPWSNRPSVS